MPLPNDCPLVRDFFNIPGNCGATKIDDEEDYLIVNRKEAEEPKETAGDTEDPHLHEDEINKGFSLI
ncbi:hypothetical protein [Pedobacter frigidisoli]|uniref:hypothetical protein n=1 Tax=Pedobacter frigidisoli TaxID=2530455 RepID=UPI0029311A0B|nr:hypothetical protein [Pedobacter frigidisoli]